MAKIKKTTNFIYTNREEKMKYIALKYRDFLKGKILDVGCWNKDLKKYLENDVEYIGIDIAGSPDIYFNLDAKLPLPFKSNSFGLVICADVLEHLENIHFVFDELCRVSEKHILISLPNPFSSIFRYLFNRRYADSLEKQKNYGKYVKFYGLPLEEPKDRHRWFFNTEDAVNFIQYRAKKNGYVIESIAYSIDQEKGVKLFLKFIFSLFQRQRMVNLFNGTTWLLLKKSF